MKRIISLIIAVSLLFSTVPLTAFAEEATVLYPVAGGTVIIRRADGMIISADKLTGSVTVPAEIAGVTISGIEVVDGVSPFESCDKLTVLTLPGTIETLPPYAITAPILYSLTLGYGTKAIEQDAVTSQELTSFVIPDSVERIEAGFVRSDIAKISISGNNPYFSMDHQGLIYNKEMNTVIAYASERLMHRDIVIPRGVVKIAEEAFASTIGSPMLKTIVFNDDLLEIADSAFMGSTGLAYLNFPNSLTKIGMYAFAFCNGLERIVVADGVEVGGYAFSACSNLSNVTVGRSMTKIPEGLFAGTMVSEIPNAIYVTEIGANAFMACPMKPVLDLMPSLKKIGANAFYGCEGIKTLNFSNSEIEIGDAAFENCGIEGIFSIGTKVSFSGTRQFAGNAINEFTAESGVFTFPKEMLDDCAALARINMPQSVTNMNNVLGDLPVTNTGIVVAGYTGSAAHIYANEQKLLFVSRGKLESKFIDVKGHWAEKDIEWANLSGLFGGITSVRFAPGDFMSRAMFAAVLYRTSDDPIPTEMSGFTDVSDDMYFARAASWAKAAGIILGTSPTTFGIGTPVKRQDIVTMLYRYAWHIGKDITERAEIDSFNDAASVSAYALEPMMWAVANGIIAGDSRNFLNPHGFATRAEVAAILHRFFEGTSETEPEPEEPEEEEPEIPEEPGEEEPSDDVPEVPVIEEPVPEEENEASL